MSFLHTPAPSLPPRPPPHTVPTTLTRALPLPCSACHTGVLYLGFLRLFRPAKELLARVSNICPQPILPPTVGPSPSQTLPESHPTLPPGPALTLLSQLWPWDPAPGRPAPSAQAPGAASFLEFLIAPGPSDWLLSSDPTWAAAWLDKRGISLGLQSIRHRRGHLGPTSQSGEPGGGGARGAKDRRLGPSEEPGR